MNFKKIQREFTDYAEMLKYVIENKEHKSLWEYFDSINEVFSLFKVNKAEYFTNPDNIPNLKVKWKVYDLGCGVGFWSSKNNNEDNEVIGLDINKTWLNIAKDISPDIEFKKFNVLEDNLDGDFTLIWNPPFDKYFQKSIFNLIEKSKESYLVIPEMWAKELAKTYKVDLLKEFIDPTDKQQMKSKYIFTWKMRAWAGFLFHIKKDNIDTEKYYKENVQDVFFKKEEDKEIGTPEEIISIMEKSQKKYNKSLKEIKNLLKQNNLGWYEKKQKTLQNSLFDNI